MSSGVTLVLWLCIPTPAHLAFRVWEEGGCLEEHPTPQNLKLLRLWTVSGLRQTRLSDTLGSRSSCGSELPSPGPQCPWRKLRPVTSADFPRPKGGANGDGDICHPWPWAPWAPGTVLGASHARVAP